MEAIIYRVPLCQDRARKTEEQYKRAVGREVQHVGILDARTEDENRITEHEDSEDQNGECFVSRLGTSPPIPLCGTAATTTVSAIRVRPHIQTITEELAVPVQPTTHLPFRRVELGPRPSSDLCAQKETPPAQCMYSLSPYFSARRHTFSTTQNPAPQLRASIYGRAPCNPFSPHRLPHQSIILLPSSPGTLWHVHHNPTATRALIQPSVEKTSATNAGTKKIT
ncbi:hypothetical protein C8R43DRAFT_1236999 [Mycena crocata]|nr:hypothetical protein C8R43DRAFT_1236999 [Mycena crocata]